LFGKLESDALAGTVLVIAGIVRSLLDRKACAEGLVASRGDGECIRSAGRRARTAVLPVLLPATTLPPAFAAEDTEARPRSLSLLAASERGLRSELAWQVDRNVLSLPLGTWPMPSLTLQAAWAGVEELKLDPVDVDALARVQRAIRRSTETVRMAARVDSALRPSLDNSDATRRGARPAAN